MQPWLTHSNFPFLLEMLYLLGLLLHGPVLAKLFHFACGWLTALAIYSFGRRFWSPRAGLLGAVTFATIPFVLWEMTVAYNELAFALYAFLALYTLAIWYETAAFLALAFRDLMRLRPRHQTPRPRRPGLRRARAADRSPRRKEPQAALLHLVAFVL